MIKRTLYLAGMLLLLARVPAFSQTPAGLSLARAWEIGLAGYPALAESQAQLRAATYQKQLVKNKFLPQLQAQLQHTYGSYAGSAGGFFPLPGIFNVSGGKDPENRSGATSGLYGSLVMDWKVFEFGRRTRELEAARLQENVARTRYSGARLATQANIGTLYLDILYNQVNADWAHTNAGRMQQVLDLARSLAQAGIKPGADTLFVLSAYRQAQAETANWQGKARAAQIQLGEVLAVATDTFALPSQAYLEAAPEKLAAVAGSDSSAHPYLQVLQQQVQVAEVQRQVINRKMFPSFSLLGGLSTRGSGLSGQEGGSAWPPGLQQPANNYLVGLGLTWQLNSAYNTRVESRLAREQIRAYQSRYQGEALRLHTTLRAQQARLVEQQKQLADARQAVVLARQAYEAYVARYESGLIGMTELLQLQFLLQQAEKARIEASQQFWNLALRQAELSGDFSFLSNQF